MRRRNMVSVVGLVLGLWLSAAGAEVPQASGLSGVVAASGGAAHTLALKSDGTVWAWGNNQYGQLGDGTTTSRSTPAKVNGLNAVVAIAAGSFHSVALKDDGTVWAWGWNGSGQLGDGTPPPPPPFADPWPDRFAVNRATPEQVSGLTGVVAITAGLSSSFAVKSDGTIWGWGGNWGGQLGDGTSTDRITPVEVSGFTRVVGIATDGGHSLALKSDGTVWAWGWNDLGQLGVGTTQNQHQLTPLPVIGLGGVVAVTVAAGGSLALKDDGTVWEWGIPEWRIQSSPAQVSGLGSVVALAGGVAPYICACGQRLALASDGTIWAWGNNEDGQLGDGTTTSRMMPARVVGLAGVKSIGAGALHSLAVNADGTVWMWGSTSWHWLD